MFYRRVFLVLLGALSCGPTPSTHESASEGTSGSSGGQTHPTEATTDAPPFSCMCDEPLVHDGDLDLGGLAAYEGKCLSEVTGALRIERVSDPAQLEPLVRVQRVSFLTVTGNPGLVDLAPLGCLREASFLSVVDNAALSDLSGLNGLVRAEHVTIENTPIAALPSFAPDYQGISGLYLRDLPALVDLDGMATWPGVADWDGGLTLSVTGAPALVSIAGLAGPLTSVPGDPTDIFTSGVAVELQDLPQLASLQGLEPFTAGDLTVSGVPKLSDLTALAGLQKAGWLFLDGLPALTSLQGLDNLGEVAVLRLGACGAGKGVGITSLAGLDALHTVGILSVVKSPGLTSLTGAPLLTNLDRLELVDDPLLTQDAVDAFVAEVGPYAHCFGDLLTCGCQGAIPEAVIAGCPANWSGGSSVVAMGPGGPLDGVTAFFGYVASGDHRLALVIADASAKLDEVKSGGLDTDFGRPKLVVETWLDYADWLSNDIPFARLVGPQEALNLPVELTITARAGDWSQTNLADPPRLLGTFIPNMEQTTVSGSFDAVFCDRFIRMPSD